MRMLAAASYRRSSAALAIALSWPERFLRVPAFAVGPSISGVVEDTSGTPQANVTVNVIDPATAATVTSTTTAGDGTVSISVGSGTYNVQFIPPATGLQSFLATDVSTDSAPLTVILKTAAVVQVQGTLADSQGDVYPSAQGGSVTFVSPLNPGNAARTDRSGNYWASLFADQNFTATAVMLAPGNATQMQSRGLPVGTLDHSQTCNLTVPTALLTVSVRDASGSPITSGKFEFGFSSISPLPSLPGSAAFAEPISGAQLDGNGNTAIPLPDGITLASPEIVLSDGLTIPFTLHPITGDRHAFTIFNETNGTVLVDDQPPVVTGSPDRAANDNGWYNAPLTITWNSVDPTPSSGTPTTPAPTTVSYDGANQIAAACSGATDNAGNSTPPVNVTYQVLPAGSTASLTDSDSNPIAARANRAHASDQNSLD